MVAALDGNVDGDRGGDDDKDTQQRRYATDAHDPSHSDTSTIAWTTTWRMIALAGTLVFAVWAGDFGVVAFVVVVVAVICRSWLLTLLLVAVAVGGLARVEQSWASIEPDRLGPYRGWVRIVDDPQPYPSSTRVIVEIEGERFEIWSRGRAQRQRVGEWRGGEWVAMDGARVRLDDERAGRVAWQHVVGEFQLEWASDVDAGGPVARASNRVRAAIERASSQLSGDDGALFRGLVVGDDREQPREMIDRFRASGLSHLTAVSGQNVSFLLAGAGPLLRRLRPWMRWAVTIGLIAWFVALTRYEPSIVRAGAMAGLSTTAFLLGRDRAPVRILAVAVIGLVLIDPLLVWSVGFWLSVGATFGVSAIGPWLATRFDRIDRTGIFSLPLGVTLGAQIGVMIPAVLVFGRLPLVSIPANLLAVPVAGMVMLYGMPAGLVAGWLPDTAPVLMFPARLGTRWVDTVASLGGRLEPEPPAQIVGWCLVAIAVVVLLVMTRNTAETHGDLPADR